MSEVKKTYLLAEDDEAIAKLIVTNLTRLGVSNVVHFPNGLEAVRYIEKHHDKEQLFLLLDIRMPVMDGIEVLKKLKDKESFCSVPVVMLTTSDNPEEIKTCYDLGCNFYVRKPVEYMKLKDVIKSIVDFMNVCSWPVQES